MPSVGGPRVRLHRRGEQSVRIPPPLGAEEAGFFFAKLVQLPTLDTVVRMGSGRTKGTPAVIVPCMYPT